ncbi:uncharacterized protein F21D5.5 isoform X2 [Diachasma alloeum]|uniref:uncharacterized protein F21D5.5 isoform X2 n=1 Tax=Diachasma alloeum TaxID=454923 RepID=UPI0010FBBBB2|nr:uncharacterized protein F21D5.5 isoform X2 [Diachasma alloeum]
MLLDFDMNPRIFIIIFFGLLNWKVRLCASYADKCVTVCQTGARPSGFDGCKTKKDEKYVRKHGDIIEILHGKYPYRIEFNPPPSENRRAPINPKKRTCIDSEGESQEFKARKKPKADFCGAEMSREVLKDNDDDVDEETSRKILEKVRARRQSPMPGGSKTDDVDYGSSSKIHKETWEDVDKQALMIFTAEGVQSRSKIAAYDMDGTLITTQSGLVFPKDLNDWKILFPGIPGKLKELHADGYKIVIFTNQGGLGLGKSKPNDFKQKIERVVKRLGVPIQVFIATARDSYRKPVTGMWDRFAKFNNDGVPIDKDNSFFVGDAAGRPKDWAPKKKKDHSLADRLFALNVGVKFYTPEEHFLGQKPVQYNLPVFDPKVLDDDVDVCDPPRAQLSSKKQEVILMVGAPGTGKTHVVRNYLKDYHHINRDKLGSWQKCVAEMEKYLSQGKSVVIDNTNPDPTSRQRFLDAAKSKNIPVRCFLMKTPIEHAKHNNRFRELTDPSHMVVSEIIINSYVGAHSTLVWRCTRFIKLLLLLCLRLLFVLSLYTYVKPYRKNFVEPSMDEGFSEIVKINFVPKFQTEKERELYTMYLLEK